MTTTLAHPFRIDASGAAVTLEQGSARHAAETCGHIVSCEAGERPLAPLWGLIDPTGTRINPDEIRAVIGYAEPALAFSGSCSYRFLARALWQDLHCEPRPSLARLSGENSSRLLT